MSRGGRECRTFIARDKQVKAHGMLQQVVLSPTEDGETTCADIELLGFLLIHGHHKNQREDAIKAWTDKFEACRRRHLRRGKSASQGNLLPRQQPRLLSLDDETPTASIEEPLAFQWQASGISRRSQGPSRLPFMEDSFPAADRHESPPPLQADEVSSNEETDDESDDIPSRSIRPQYRQLPWAEEASQNARGHAPQYSAWMACRQYRRISWSEEATIEHHSISSGDISSTSSRRRHRRHLWSEEINNQYHSNAPDDIPSRANHQRYRQRPWSEGTSDNMNVSEDASMSLNHSRYLHPTPSRSIHEPDPTILARLAEEDLPINTEGNTQRGFVITMLSVAIGFFTQWGFTRLQVLWGKVLDTEDSTFIFQFTVVLTLPLRVLRQHAPLFLWLAWIWFPSVPITLLGWRYGCLVSGMICCAGLHRLGRYIWQ
ncbi:hypothetical protein NUU61_007321 [Penicillium alfredii]|uniref:Uncharacterized protein n=1 Tax=Penicillium alfredii TaxID=1506179 RepID=A0A9W9F2N2_9EURO|nr:uncharacterized protein NUU61_007321 [Penicillium alfredii]KAJ5092451.1 hypothetical protein NUU61_007321 [Penicillium alfredii]